MTSNSRTQQRENAFLVFYSNLFIHGTDTTLENEAEMLSILDSVKPGEVPDEFFYEILKNTKTHLDEIRGNIQTCLKGWRLERLAKIDYSLLILGSSELFHLKDKTPLPVVCNEYVELAKKFGHADSPNFINATLESISKLKQS